LEAKTDDPKGFVKPANTPPKSEEPKQKAAITKPAATPPVETPPPVVEKTATTPEPEKTKAVEPTTPPPTPPPPPPPVAAAKVTIPSRTNISASPASDICESSKVGDPVRLSLDAPVQLSDGTSLPAGTGMTGRITGRRSTGNQPPLIEIEAVGLTVDSKPAAIETNPVSFQLNRPSSTGRIVKGAVIGAAAGTALGFILKKNPALTAAGGAAAGAGVAAATRPDEEACVSLEETTFVFRLTREAVVR
jgi:hypothetical protein